MSTNQRLMLVHAHPDDETIGTGATMAKYANSGAHVTLVTCTLGDEGEILIPEYAHLAADKDDSLAAHRHIELERAMQALGVQDWRILGGPGKFRDSGMIGTPPNQRPDSFWQADLLEPTKLLVEIIRQVRPQVLITYDDFGGYGHPDHIKAHRVAMYASVLAAAKTFAPELGPAWDIEKIYWTAFPISVVRQGIEALRAMGDQTDFATENPEDVAFACPDEWISTVINAPEFAPHKIAAMKAHATQINTDEGFFALSNNLGAQIMGIEFFRLIKGQAQAPFDSEGREIDIFAGVQS